MTRKDFLKKSMTSIGVISLTPFISGCSKDESIITETVVNGGNPDCLVLPIETAGPFPTRNPNSLVMEDITGDREGVPLTINLLIAKSNNCTAIENARVDIWYCDAAGNYSEYVLNSSLHFLRGRQITNSEGMVSFKGIFPGWYPGRAPHIHVQIFDNNDNSLLVTQLAFPKAICDTVYTTATNFYKKGKQDTSNEKDNTFRDGTAVQLAKIEGNLANGLILTHTIAL